MHVSPYHIISTHTVHAHIYTQSHKHINTHKDTKTLRHIRISVQKLCESAQFKQINYFIQNA